MKVSILYLGIVLFAMLTLLVGCGEDEKEELLVSDLKGLWEVSVPNFEFVVIDTYDITIQQSDDLVSFVRDEETISTGNISGDTIQCTDWYGYGIHEIYIDSATSMHSQMPDNESLNPIQFTKK